MGSDRGGYDGSRFLSWKEPQVAESIAFAYAVKRSSERQRALASGSAVEALERERWE